MATTTAPTRARGHASPARRRLLAGYEAGILAALCAWSLLGLLLVTLGGYHSGDMFTGSDGPVIGDHLQYMAWIRDAGDHVLFSNRFDVVPDPHLFLHPMFALSGLLWKLGASLQFAFLVWKPVGVLVVFGGFLAYVRRLIGPESPWARVGALVLALFFFTPASPLQEWAGIAPAYKFPTLVIGLEMFPAGDLLGLLPTAISIGLMPLFLLAIEAAMRPERRRPGWSGRRYAVVAAAAGAFCSWLHPWQGLTLLGIVAGIVAWGRFRREHLRLVVPVLGAMAPLLYYYAVAQTDSAWGVVSHASDMPHLHWWLAMGLGPLLLLALPGFPGKDLDFQERALRLWPVAAFVVYFALTSSYFYHAFAGLSLPLAVLALRGWQRLRAPAPVAVAAVVALTVPGVIFFARDLLYEPAADHFLNRSESAALHYLARSSRQGAVLAPVELGRAVPAFTGRQTWNGHATWTPSNTYRSERARQLFQGELPRADAEALVRQVRPAYLLAGCRDRVDLRPLLPSLVAQTRRFGCATVYELRR